MPVALGDPLRPAGTGKVASNGAVAALREAGLLVAPANTDIPSYVVNFNVAPVAAMDIITVFFSAVTPKVLRLRRIVLVNPGNATAAATVDLTLGTATALGSGGGTATARPVDAATRPAGVTGGPDAAAASLPVTVQTGDTTQATGFVALYAPLASVTVPATAGGFSPLPIYDARDPRFKAITYAGTAGTPFPVLRIAAVGAGATGFRGYAEFTVDDA